MIQSVLQQRGGVAFPEHTGERIYMLPFSKRLGLPKQFGRWQPTVDRMLEGIETSEPIYLMVDQGVVTYNAAQRRPGVHVDGYWNSGYTSYGSISAHGGRPSHGGHREAPSHGGRRGHGGTPRHSAGSNGWDRIDFSAPEAVLLAANVSACAAYVGQYDEQLIGEGGDASRIPLDNMDRVVLDSHVVYAGNVGMLHESLPTQREMRRTLVRLNVPGWTP
jgi:hypothetical protein